ncbi:PepSY domain-containing protein [Lysobacter niastensis]|uniref:PepSY domain-containing protein n=1 Tax=Lysobacter niastensis TaxID=380629 RepID=A0ABS0BAJ1_9GAMM|nr:PepSY domain-containing protein [Lysobacter niastensis]MBF6024862.1 PepSY domain-containing protein [Lysobacter niastensis]
MKPAFWARRAHKWIALVVGVQALLWMLSGLYMTSISIEIIHGDHLAHASSKPLVPTASVIGPDALSAQYPGITTFRLKRFLDREVYEVHQPEQITLVDARSGARLSPLDEAAARQLATSLYQGEAPIASVKLLQEAPREVASRPVPMWGVTFADNNETTLYLSPQTGELLAKRHDLWRWFDFLWMFHIMDYEEREDVNNTLLRTASSIGLVFALSGLWLLFYSFSRRRAA